LNGGPGAPAYLYVAEKHQAAIRPPLSGWMGHEAPFAFDTDYRPAPGIERHLCGTPAILAMAALEVSVEITARADMERWRNRGRWETCSSGSWRKRAGRLASPGGPARFRKAGVSSLRHAQGYPIIRLLIAENVIEISWRPISSGFGFTRSTFATSTSGTRSWS
jgi:kynureninase